MAQQASGQSIRTFCREQGIGEHSFYNWRKRVRTTRRVEFALVETKPAPTPVLAPTWALEVSLAGGAQVRIANGADPGTLRCLFETLRA